MSVFAKPCAVGQCVRRSHKDLRHKVIVLIPPYRHNRAAAATAAMITALYVQRASVSLVIRNWVNNVLQRWYPKSPQNINLHSRRRHQC